MAERPANGAQLYKGLAGRAALTGTSALLLAVAAVVAGSHNLAAVVAINGGTVSLIAATACAGLLISAARPGRAPDPRRVRAARVAWRISLAALGTGSLAALGTGAIASMREHDATSLGIAGYAVLLVALFVLPQVRGLPRRLRPPASGS